SRTHPPPISHLFPYPPLFRSPAAPEVYRFDDVEVNIRGNEVRRAGAPVDLSAKEFALLAYFISHPAETLSRDRLLDEVWGYENRSEEHTSELQSLTNLVCRLL